MTRARLDNQTLGALGAAAWAIALGIGCGVADPRKSQPSASTPNALENASFFRPEATLDSTTPEAAGATDLEGLVDPQADGARPIQVDEACIVGSSREALIKEGVDIILLLDNSGSMADELEAAERNVNLNFTAILDAAGIDYRVILISRHRKGPRSTSAEQSTSVCVASPLSRLETCEAAPQPAFGPRFFHYSTKIESDDSFDVLLDTYAAPFDESREERFDNAPDGWSAWLRPGTKKVILEMSDDNEDMSAQEAIQALTQSAPEHFGIDAQHPSFVFHSIVGLAEKPTPTRAYLPDEPIQLEECTGNNNTVDDAGASYQELSRLTGGLRFPLCQFDSYDVVFSQIADDLIVTTGLACDFPIPQAPAGTALDLRTLALAYGDAEEVVQLGQVSEPASCDEAPVDAFYVGGQLLTLCPRACAALRASTATDVDILFTCRNQILDPR